jgi:peptidoglycan hydrolase-like protein with peptidoglycan-binding domain
VVDQPAHTETVTIPAEYKTVKVQKLVSAAQEQRVPIPAEYQTVSKTEKVSDERVEWRRVVCQTNENHDLILKAQQALKAAGYNPGKLDGVLGPDTLAATRAYEKDKGIGHADGAITYETLASLGVTG